MTFERCRLWLMMSRSSSFWVMKFFSLSRRLWNSVSAPSSNSARERLISSIWVRIWLAMSPISKETSCFEPSMARTAVLRPPKRSASSASSAYCSTIRSLSFLSIAALVPSMPLARCCAASGLPMNFSRRIRAMSRRLSAVFSSASSSASTISLFLTACS